MVIIATFIQGLGPADSGLIKLSTRRSPALSAWLKWVNNAEYFTDSDINAAVGEKYIPILRKANPQALQHFVQIPWELLCQREVK